MHSHSRLDPIAEDSHTSPGITCIHAQKNHTLILYYASDLRSRTQLLINTIQAGSDVRPRSYLIPGGAIPIAPAWEQLDCQSDTPFSLTL